MVIPGGMEGTFHVNVVAGTVEVNVTFACCPEHIAREEGFGITFGIGLTVTT